MADGQTANALFDTRTYTFLPLWAKGLVLGAGVVLLVLAVLLVAQALDAGDASDRIVLGLSLAQTAALALIFAVVVLFSTRDANARHLQRLGDAFLTGYVTEALSRVSVPAQGIDRFEVTDLGRNDIFGRVLEMRGKSLALRLWVGLNVHRIHVIYFIPLGGAVTIDAVREALAHTCNGAEKAGYSVTLEQASHQGVDFVSIWLPVEASRDLLYSPRDKLFWAQDIAMMTESLIRSAVRAGLPLGHAGLYPGPL